MFTRSVLCGDDKQLFEKAERKMADIAARSVASNSEVRRIRQSLNEVRISQVGIKGEMSYMSKIHTSIASDTSRAKYFPDMSRSEFLVWAAKELGVS